jgi:hypothetical protein
MPGELLPACPHIGADNRANRGRAGIKGRGAVGQVVLLSIVEFQ